MKIKISELLKNSSDKGIINFINDILYKMYEDKDHLYFISNLSVSKSKIGELTIDVEWGEIVKTN